MPSLCLRVLRSRGLPDPLRFAVDSLRLQRGRSIGLHVSRELTAAWFRWRPWHETRARGHSNHSPGPVPARRCGSSLTSLSHGRAREQGVVVDSATPILPVARCPRRCAPSSSFRAQMDGTPALNVQREVETWRDIRERTDHRHRHSSRGRRGLAPHIAPVAGRHGLAHDRRPLSRQRGQARVARAQEAKEEAVGTTPRSSSRPSARVRATNVELHLRRSARATRTAWTVLSAVNASRPATPRGAGLHCRLLDPEAGTSPRGTAPMSLEDAFVRT